MTRVAAVSMGLEGDDFSDVRQSLIIGTCNRLTCANPTLQARQLSQAQGALHVRQAVIETQFGHVVGMRATGFTRAMVAVDAVIAEAAHMRGKGGIMREGHATLACGQMLDG